LPIYPLALSPPPHPQPTLHEVHHARLYSRSNSYPRLTSSGHSSEHHQHAALRRPGQPPSLQAPQQQQQPAQPTPQQADALKHHQLGKTVAYLFGAQVDPTTGEPVRQKPGTLFRSLLAGALLGGAIGSEGNAGGGKVGGFLGGLGRGAAGVEQQAYQRDQQAQQQAQTNAQHKQEMTLEQQKFDEEKMQHAAAAEHWNIQNLLSEREADYRDREQLEKENEIDLNVQKIVTPTQDVHRHAADAQDEQTARIKEATVLGRNTATTTAISATNKIATIFTTLVLGESHLP
jgi:hypothetical protein